MREQGQSMLNGSGVHRPSWEKIWLPKVLAKNTIGIFLLILLCIGAFFSTRVLDSSVIVSTGPPSSALLIVCVLDAACVMYQYLILSISQLAVTLHKFPKEINFFRHNIT